MRHSERSPEGEVKSFDLLRMVRRMVSEVEPNLSSMRFFVAQNAPQNDGKIKISMSNITLPELGEGITKATVAFWHTKIGDQVQEGDDVVELETDKATFNVPAPRAGVIKKIFFKEGQEARIGEVLAVLEPQ